MVGTPTPKDRFTSLDTLAVVRELRGLGNARVDKAFDAEGPGWSVSFTVAGEGKRELVVVPGRYAALLPSLRPHAEELSPLARELRRLLGGAVLRSVAEPAGERYLELTFGRSDDPDALLVAAELFGAGNLVVARGGTIAAVARPRGWAHRAVRIGAAYARPPVRADPWSLSVAAITGELERSRTDLASTLAARLGLGGPLAEEVVARGGWSGTEAAAAASAHAGRLHEILAALLAEVGERPHGYLYRKGELLVDATPYPSHRWTGEAEVERRASFSLAAIEYFPTTIVPEPTAEESARSQLTAERERLRVRQARAVEELSAEMIARREEADAILAHFPEAEAALARSGGAGAASGTLEVVLGGRSVHLVIGRSPRYSAQALYAESKRLAEKLDGARAALAETERLPAVAVAPGPSRSRSKPTPTRRAFWFERYRWFLSSEGVIAIAGRDAASNDVIVRRHLKAGDIYVHADLHGAASVVVKRPEGPVEIGAATKREAAQWALAFSKAWRAGLASGEAFWATPEQVSKAAASGEFVPRGAWVIHGTKHFERDLPLELAIGPVRYRDEERWTAAPESAVRARGEVRCLVTPGDERGRADVEVALARDLGVDRNLLQSLLPAGGLTVRRA